MSDKKIIHELSIEDLIALASGAKPEEVVQKVSDAGKMIFELKIKHGDTKVSAAIIYHTYKHWKGWDQKRQSKPIFFKDFKKYFEPFRNGDGIYYLLNPKPFDLSEEAYWIVRKELREEKMKRKQK